MVLKTRVTEMLGIEHPIVMGGLTGVGTPELAAAVSNAGGLGLFAVHNAGSPDKAREVRCMCHPAGVIILLAGRVSGGRGHAALDSVSRLVTVAVLCRWWSRAVCVACSGWHA